VSIRNVEAVADRRAAATTCSAAAAVAPRRQRRRPAASAVADSHRQRSAERAERTQLRDAVHAEAERILGIEHLYAQVVPFRIEGVRRQRKWARKISCTDRS
jgi:hypothetical protein